MSSKTESRLWDLLSGCGVMSGEGASPDLGGRGVANGLSSSVLGVVDMEAIGRVGVIVVIVVVVVVVAVVVTVVMACGVCLERGREWDGCWTDFGEPKSSFRAGLSQLARLASNERGFGET